MLDQDPPILPINGGDERQNERRKKQENDGDASQDVIVSAGDDSNHGTFGYQDRC